MAITLRNFRPIGFAGKEPGAEVHIDDSGRVVPAAAAHAEGIDCSGAWLSPGWCDLHVHVWHGGTDISVPADAAGLARGVTAMVDAGSAGEATFAGFRQYVLDQRPETIRAFLNIGTIGLVACNRVPELIDHRFIDVERTLATIAEHRDVILGVKIRASGVIVGDWGITPARIAKRVAEIAKLPVMVHVGEPPPVLDEVMDLLTAGDILTHCFNGKPGGSIADHPALLRRMADLQSHGVILDVGHGQASFDFTVAQLAVENGLLPTTISTDLHARNIDGPVFDLATTAAKLLAVGMPLAECVTAISSRPRAAAGLDPDGGLHSGDTAAFTVFDVAEGGAEGVDSRGQTRELRQVLEPRYAVLGSRCETASRYTADA